MAELPTHIHVIGVGGSGMSAIARLLTGLGHEVSGSDLHPSPTLDRLLDAGVRTWVGHRPDAVQSVDLVVASSAVPESDPERRAAERLGIQVWDRPQLLEVLTDQTPTIGATGTHGKTTSTGLMLFAARGVGLDPSFVIGGELVGLDTNAGVGDDDLFVLEVDEAFGTFLGLHLRGLVVTNLEADHLDYYQTVERLEDAFVDVVRRVDGPVVLCEDDPGARRIAARTNRPTYGLSQDASIRIDDVDVGGSEVRFRFGGEQVVVSKPGVHIARNAAGVLALARELGMDIDAAIEGLQAFRGVKRRFELLGRAAGVTVIDDYAHLPTEIVANLDAARHGPWRRIWAVFQPHRYTRTLELHREFGAAFTAADEVVVTDVYPADEPPIPGVSGELVADAIRAQQPNVSYVPNRDDLPTFIARSVQDGDLVLTLGAGDISGLGPKLLDLLEHR
jgi:UDP-N-acetylmuramate--alanine ligase